MPEMPACPQFPPAPEKDTSLSAPEPTLCTEHCDCTGWECKQVDISTFSALGHLFFPPVPLFGWYSMVETFIVQLCDTDIVFFLIQPTIQDVSVFFYIQFWDLLICFLVSSYLLQSLSVLLFWSLPNNNNNKTGKYFADHNFTVTGIVWASL